MQNVIFSATFASFTPPNNASGGEFSQIPCFLRHFRPLASVSMPLWRRKPHESSFSPPEVQQTGSDLLFPAEKIAFYLFFSASARFTSSQQPKSGGENRIFPLFLRQGPKSAPLNPSVSALSPARSAALTRPMPPTDKPLPTHGRLSPQL